MRTTFHDDLEVRSSPRSWRDRPAKGRVHVAYELGHQPEPTGPLCSDENCGSPTCAQYRKSGGQYGRLEVDHKVWRRWLRQAIANQKTIIREAVAQHFNVDPDQLTLRFSEKAGCSCGCSPGYIVDHAPSAWNTTTWVAPRKRVAPGATATRGVEILAACLKELVRV